MSDHGPVQVMRTWASWLCQSRPSSSSKKADLLTGVCPYQRTLPRRSGQAFFHPTTNPVNGHTWLSTDVDLVRYDGPRWEPLKPG